jgi:uncharacterized protein YqgC (DUF456 family)
MTEPVATDEHESVVRRRASMRWWCWLIGTVLVAIVVMALLSEVFPVASAVLAGFGASAFGSQRASEPRRSDQAPLWVPMALHAVLFVGLGLLLGATGLGSDGHRDTAGTGALLGGALVVGAALVTLVLVLRRRRRAVDAEVERVRDEQSPSTTADDPS